MTDKRVILARLADPEDGFVERKSEGVKPDQLRKTFCAFANSLPENGEALLLIGVSDDGDITGIVRTEAVQKRVDEACRRDCYPPIDYQVTIIEHGAKTIVAVVIFASKTKPHFSGPAYLRRGARSVKATKEQYEALIHSRHDTCAKIQSFGQQILSVVSYKKLGSTKRVSDRGFREGCKCTVVSVDSHTLRLQSVESGTHFVEPLANITVSFHVERNRPLLMVREAS